MAAGSPHENLATVIDGAADAAPDRLALAMDDGSTCSYGSLRAVVQRWAATLSEAGVGPGDRVALLDWGGERSAAVTLAAAKLGAATTQMNPLLTSRELGDLVEVAGGGVVGVSGADGHQKLAAALGPDGVVLDRPDPAASAAPAPAEGGDAVAVVLFTSGTTGLPKAVPLSHRAALDRIRAYRPPFDADRPFSVSLMSCRRSTSAGCSGCWWPSTAATPPSCCRASTPAAGWPWWRSTGW